MHAAQLSGAAQFGTVPRISRKCGGAAPLAAMPHRADRIQFYLCGAALGGGSTLGLRTSIQPIEKYYKILQNHVSVSIRESHHGVLVHREQTQAARCRRRSNCCGAVPRHSATPRASRTGLKGAFLYLFCLFWKSLIEMGAFLYLFLEESEGYETSSALPAETWTIQKRSGHIHNTT